MKSTDAKQKARTFPSANGKQSGPGNLGTKIKRPYPRFAQDFSGESKTQQHFADGCNVNNIVAHFIQTGVDPHEDKIAKQQFGFASGQTFEEALRATAEVKSAFEDLPATERQSFDNDAGQWLEAKLTTAPSQEAKTPPEGSHEPDKLSKPEIKPEAPEKGAETGEKEST